MGNLLNVSYAIDQFRRIYEWDRLYVDISFVSNAEIINNLTKEGSSPVISIKFRISPYRIVSFLIWA